ncbi:MAG: aminotransferase class I/II-fold pyridoxal phosphate-dependent enzyme [Balneolaceae bacterium]
MRFETRSIHTGLDIGNPSTAIVPPISPSNIFEIDPEGKQAGDYHYSRLQNPNRQQFEAVLTSLEGGADAAAFSSGVAAAAAILQSLEPGDHVLMPEDVYAGNRWLVQKLLLRWNLDVEFMAMHDPEEVRSRLRKETALVWIESPSNPLMRLTDIAETVRLAHEAGAVVAVDNTWPTPVNQRPLEQGADLVLHSTSKYFGGHSDLIGGAVICREGTPLFDQIRRGQILGGAVPSPNDCWLFARSTRTLAYRMRGHNENAFALARFLESHERIDRVFYPGLESHPQYAIAKKQMDGYGGMISFLLDGHATDAIGVVGRSNLVKRATSLGGVESTWEHRQSSEGEGSVSPDNLIRISVGLEHPDDLLEDVQKALKG